MADSLASLRGRKGAYTLHATHDPKETTKPARAAFLARFEPDDPGLTPAERARRAEMARKAYFAGLALKSAKARRARKRGQQ
jgi:hypothetical protein